MRREVDHSGTPDPKGRSPRILTGSIRIASALTAPSRDFVFFDPARIVTSEFEIIYAIIADWHGRSLAEALPFFSKVNLRRTVQDLSSRGFNVSCRRVSIARP